MSGCNKHLLLTPTRVWCRNERLYMGKMCSESEVLLQPGHKWNNIVFYNHTGLKTYPHYMCGRVDTLTQTLLCTAFCQVCHARLRAETFLQASRTMRGCWPATMVYGFRVFVYLIPGWEGGTC